MAVSAFSTRGQSAWESEFKSSALEASTLPTKLSPQTFQRIDCFLFTCEWPCTCVGVFTAACRQKPEVTLRCLPPQALASVFPSFLSELTDLVRLRNPPSHLYLLSTGATSCAPHSALTCVLGSNPGSHACMASTLPTTPSPPDSWLSQGGK